MCHNIRAFDVSLARTKTNLIDQLKVVNQGINNTATKRGQIDQGMVYVDQATPIFILYYIIYFYYVKLFCGISILKS